MVRIDKDSRAKLLSNITKILASDDFSDNRENTSMLLLTMACEYEDKISKLKAQLMAAIQREEEWQHRFEMLEERKDCNDLVYAQVIEKVEIEERFFQVDDDCDCDCEESQKIREMASEKTDSIDFEAQIGRASCRERVC